MPIYLSTNAYLSLYLTCVAGVNQLAQSTGGTFDWPRRFEIVTSFVLGLGNIGRQRVRGVSAAGIFPLKASRIQRRTSIEVCSSFTSHDNLGRAALVCTIALNDEISDTGD